MNKKKHNLKSFIKYSIGSALIILALIILALAELPKKLTEKDLNDVFE